MQEGSFAGAPLLRGSSLRECMRVYACECVCFGMIVCVCACKCKRMHIFMCMYLCRYTGLYERKHGCTLAFVCVCACARVCVCVCIWMNASMVAHARLCVWMCEHMSMHVFLWRCISMRLCVQTWHSHKHFVIDWLPQAGSRDYRHNEVLYWITVMPTRTGLIPIQNTHPASHLFTLLLAFFVCWLRLFGFRIICLCVCMVCVHVCVLVFFFLGLF